MSMFPFREENASDLKSISMPVSVIKRLWVKEIDPELLLNIRCPKCSNYYFLPIYLCPKGHNLCNKCKEEFKYDSSIFGNPANGSTSNTVPMFGLFSPNSSTTPTKVPPSTQTRTKSNNPASSSSSSSGIINGFGNFFCGKCSNYFPKIPARRTTAREKSIKILNFPCGNADKKCPYRSNLVQIEEHEQTCIYAPRSCFYDGCDWKDTTETIINHIKEKHTFIEMNKNQILLEGINIYPLLYDKVFFILKTSYSACESLRFSVLYPGETNKYKFDIFFMGYNEDIGIKLTNYCETLMNESVKADNLLADDITLPFDCLKHFITDLQKLRFKINISKIC